MPDIAGSVAQAEAHILRLRMDAAEIDYEAATMRREAARLELEMVRKRIEDQAKGPLERRMVPRSSPLHSDNGNAER